MPQTWESVFAALVRDYLNSEGALASGVPDATDLPKATQDEATPADRPSIIVAARITESRGKHFRVILVSVNLFTMIGEDGTDPALAGTWMQSIREALQDWNAFFPWLADLPFERRTGWCLLKQPQLGEPETANDSTKHTRDYNQPLTFRLAVDF